MTIKIRVSETLEELSGCDLDDRDFSAQWIQRTQEELSITRLHGDYICYELDLKQICRLFADLELQSETMETLMGLYVDEVNDDAYTRGQQNMQESAYMSGVYGDSQ